MEPPEFRGITFLGISKGPNGTLDEKESEHPAQVASAHVVARLPIGPKNRRVGRKGRS